MGADVYMIAVLFIRWANMVASLTNPNGELRHMRYHFNLLGY